MSTFQPGDFADRLREHTKAVDDELKKRAKATKRAGQLRRDASRERGVKQPPAPDRAHPPEPPKQ